MAHVPECWGKVEGLYRDVRRRVSTVHFEPVSGSTGHNPRIAAGQDQPAGMIQGSA